MVNRKKRKSLLGNHQQCWLWGRHAVLETLQAGRWRPYEIRIAPDTLPPDVMLSIDTLRGSVPLKISTSDQLQKLCGARDHQGMIAQMPDYPYADLHDVFQHLSPVPFLLILDGIQDPFNFGSILRSADIFGVDGVVISSTGQANVTSHVVRSSVGAVNYLRISRCDSLLDVLGQCRQNGMEIIAASEQAEQTVHERDLSQPIALIIGNEGRGVQPELLQACTGAVRIPQQGHVDSLNAAVAAGILCYETHRQRVQRS